MDIRTLSILLLLFLAQPSFSKYDLKEIERQVNYYSQLLKDKNSSVRLDAVEKLSALQHKKTIPALAKAIKDKNIFIRNKAVESLGNLPYRDTTPILLAQLKKEKNIFVIRQGLIALSKLKDERSRSYLEKMSKHKSILIRTEAKKALESLNKK